MEKGMWLFPGPTDILVSVSSPNLHLDGPKESCQNDAVKASQTQLQQGQHGASSA